MRYLVFGGLLVSSILLSGCNTIAGTISGVGTDNAPSPSPLVAFKQQVPVRSVWMAHAGGLVGNDYLKLGPFINGDKIFTADAKGNVFATDLRTGKRFWTVNLKTPITSGPVACEGVVVVGTGNGRVLAIDENKGTPLWHTDVPDAVLSTPAIGQGRVFIKTVDGKLCALSAQTGKILWVYDHGAPSLVMRSGGAPLIAGNEVIAGFPDGKLAAFNLQGSLLWEEEIATPQGISPVEQMVDVDADPVAAANGVVYVSTYQGSLAALNLFTGHILWSQRISSYTGLSLGAGKVFVTDADDTVWAFDQESGAVLWQQSQLCHRVLSEPVMAGRAVVVGDGFGYLHFLSPEDGHTVARVLLEHNAKILAPPVAIGNFVYVGNVNGVLSAWQVG